MYLFLIFLICGLAPLFSQISLPGQSGPPDPELIMTLDKETYRPGEKAVISVEFLFPEDYHQTFDPVNFRLEGLVSNSILFGSTLYSEGVLDEAEIVQYYGNAVLRLEMMISETAPAGQLTGAVNAHFQLCD
ncbi:hypothetical protein, partial [Oceanispirochaeta sp.]|uniref:hypothetical protein n=1 Tax=Oceanispirochaeta sp. TaxID=2035350 RepID=UPI0026022CB7